MPPQFYVAVQQKNAPDPHSYHTLSLTLSLSLPLHSPPQEDCDILARLSSSIFLQDTPPPLEGFMCTGVDTSTLNVTAVVATHPEVRGARAGRGRVGRQETSRSQVGSQERGRGGARRGRRVTLVKDLGGEWEEK